MRRSCVALLALWLFGCSHGTLVPASAATLVPGAPDAAFAIVSGVRCSADVGQAAEVSGDLPSGVVPVKVRVVNESGSPVRLLQADFALMGSSGRVYRPLPVLPASGADHRKLPRVLPIYASTKFFVAPRLHDAYPTLEPWSVPLNRDDAAYERGLRRWGKDGPSLEVMRMALPEGVLDDGGIISGFLFFESPLDKENRVAFHADFGSSDGQTRIASIAIPFQVQ